MKNFNPQSQKKVLNLQFENFFNMLRMSIMDRMFKKVYVFAKQQLGWWLNSSDF